MGKLYGILHTPAGHLLSPSRLVCLLVGKLRRSLASPTLLWHPRASCETVARLSHRRRRRRSYLGRASGGGFRVIQSSPPSQP